MDALANRKNGHLLQDGIIDGANVKGTPLRIHADIIRIRADIFGVVRECNPVGGWRGNVFLP